MLCANDEFLIPDEWGSLSMSEIIYASSIGREREFGKTEGQLLSVKFDQIRVNRAEMKDHAVWDNKSWLMLGLKNLTVCSFCKKQVKNTYP